MKGVHLKKKKRKQQKPEPTKATAKAQANSHDQHKPEPPTRNHHYKATEYSELERIHTNTQKYHL